MCEPENKTLITVEHETVCYGCRKPIEMGDDCYLVRGAVYHETCITKERDGHETKR